MNVAIEGSCSTQALKHASTWQKSALKWFCHNTCPPSQISSIHSFISLCKITFFPQFKQGTLIHFSLVIERYSGPEHSSGHSFTVPALFETPRLSFNVFVPAKPTFPLTPRDDELLSKCRCEAFV